MALHRHARSWYAALLILVLVVAGAAPAAAESARVVILPFDANAQGDIGFLVKGVRDMLASRLAWQDKVSVVEPDLVTPVLAKIAAPYNDAKARQVAQALSAQVVVYGSITQLGKALSVDARVVKIDQDKPALTAFMQAPDLDQVIPKVNDFAQRINAEIFKRPDAVAARQQDQAAGAGAAAVGGGGEGEPRTVQNEDDDLPDNISPLNPMFLRRLSGVESDRYWRSPRIPGTVNSVAVGDIDNDGKNELVMLMDHSVRLYRLNGQYFSLLQEIKNGPQGDYLFADIADIDHNGAKEIYISNSFNGLPHSFVLEWTGNGLGFKAKDVGWYFRVQKDVGTDKREDILMGQGGSVTQPFAGDIYRLDWKNGDIDDVENMHLPKECTIFNFALADLNGSGQRFIVVVGPSYYLLVFNPAGEQVWMSGEQYAAGGKFIRYRELQATDAMDEDWWFINARILVTDMDGDGRDELVVVRNQDRAALTLARMRMFYQGTIYGLTWNGMSLQEQWRTPRMSGYLSDYMLGDVGNVGRPALVMSIGQKTLSGLMDKNFSTVVAFTLKPQATEKPKENKGL